MKLQKLIEVLRAAGKAPELCPFPDGSRALVLPYGGRILGLFSPLSEQDFFWSHPALESAESAQRFYESMEWHNSGGDRTWLSPELDLFFPHYPDLERYFQPRQLDPGNYRMTRVDGGMRLCNRLGISLARCGSKVEVQITKELGAAPNPLRHDPEFAAAGLEYAGYTLRTSLEILKWSPELPPRLGIWNLLQLPHGGDLLVPTYRREEPRIWFGEVPPGDLEIEERAVRYRMRAKGGQKIGLRAAATPGRAGYLFAEAGGTALVIRNFFVDPSGEYGDLTWNAPCELEYSFQACNVDNELGSFSELEYHAPAAGRVSGSVRTEDISQVWAFRGAAERIRAVSFALLGMT